MIASNLPRKRAMATGVLVQNGLLIEEGFRFLIRRGKRQCVESGNHRIALGQMVKVIWPSTDPPASGRVVNINGCSDEKKMLEIRLRGRHTVVVKFDFDEVIPIRR